MKLIVEILVLLLCMSALGANYVYQGNGSDPDNWFDDANWSEAGGVTNWPAAGDNALFTSELGMTVSQAVPSFNQLQPGRGATNTVTVAAGGVMTNLNQTVVGILDNGEGHLIVDGGTLVTKALRLNVFDANTSVLSPETSFELKAGAVHVNASFGGVNAGDVDFGLNESATMKISGGALTVDNNLDFTAGLLEITGTAGSVNIGNSLNLGTGAGSKTELAFVLGVTGGVTTVFAGSFALQGVSTIKVDGRFAVGQGAQNLILIDLQSDTFEAAEFAVLSNNFSMAGMTGGELSLSADGSQLLFSGAPSEQRPNIIIIYTDDHGFTDLGAHGIDDNVQTPVLDSLVTGGALMANGYSTAPQCVPSRAGLMSGRIQNTFGTRQNGDIWGPHPVPLDVPTIAERLVELGTYRTGMVGKWHLEPPPDTVAGVDYPGVKDDYWPENRGFQGYFRNPVSPYTANFDLSGNTLDPAQSIADARNRVIVQGEAAETFIERNQSEPFFLYLALFGPHLPRMSKTDSYYLNFPELDYPHYSAEMDDIRRLGLGLVWAIDDAVGGVMQKLRDLELEENTLIFFAGDNGAQPKFWDGVPGSTTLGMWTGNENIPLRGEKGSLWEGGVKVPMFAYWKNHIPGGQVIGEPVWTLDFTATVLKLAGGSVPAEFDGVDILPRLTGETNTIVRTKELFWDWGQEIALRDGDWKIHRIGGRKALFNLTDDPYELFDLQYDEPEKFAEMEVKLMARYHALPADGQSPLSDDTPDWYELGAPTNYTADPRFLVPYTSPAPVPYPAPLTVLNDPYADADGDGMTDTAELAKGRNPSNAVDMSFEFNTDGDFEGWDGKILIGDEDYVTNAAVTGGMLVGENIDGNRGQFEHYDFSFSGSEVSNLLMRVGSPVASGLVFRWATAAQNVFAQDRTLLASYETGETNVIVIPVGVHTQWTGQVITQMRLNPANVPAPFAVDWIRASDGDYDDDGVSDSDEDIAGSDPTLSSDFFKIQNNPFVLTETVQVQFSCRADRTYTLLYSADLISNGWIAVDSFTAPEDAHCSVVHTNCENSGFYKVEVSY
ncbi:sulfatase family protein [Tichowtungia aerotolerans]|uniref:Sulfatase-like hydrolase/transferase n=1 Tax=Tichowtungia aerotolerans TaxID=2697043 RepID=A0A6P1MBZ6_9BACT|nr:sulfatase-like hydrolase/transferase [Tichowtungia aerotolerans]QHI70074.1 sulfatase-like hydrolase/transferase [Tichowtungia aerotolerans]